MAMKPQLWNTHALAVEFGLGYRVAAARLADVPVARMKGRQALYRLQDAAPVLLGNGSWFLISFGSGGLRSTRMRRRGSLRGYLGRIGSARLGLTGMRRSG
jgi:hypothetical protein